MEQGTNSEKRLEFWSQMQEFLLFLFLVLLLMQDECNLHVYFEVLLNVNTRYCIWFDAVVNGLTILVCILGCHDYSNKRVENQAQFGGPLNWAQAVLLMSLAMSPAISIAMSPAMLAPLSTSLTCQQPCYWPCHHCYPRHRQVNSHVILHVINVWHGNWICDENYTVCDVYFCHRKWVWVGLWGPEDIIWRFQNVMDEAIYDKILKNITRCDLWCSIHDVIWDRHRYCFMMVF